MLSKQFLLVEADYFKQEERILPVATARGGELIDRGTARERVNSMYRGTYLVFRFRTESDARNFRRDLKFIAHSEQVPAKDATYDPLTRSFSSYEPRNHVQVVY